jgi:hypothetical protein
VERQDEAEPEYRVKCPKCATEHRTDAADLHPFIRGCSAFSWYEQPKVARLLLAAHSEAKIVEDEYGERLTGGEFLTFLGDHHPIEYPPNEPVNDFWWEDGRGLEGLLEQVRAEERRRWESSPLYRAAQVYVAAWKQREEFDGDDDAEENEAVGYMPYETGEDLKAAAREMLLPGYGSRRNKREPPQ